MATTTTLQQRLTNSINASNRDKRSRWTIQYEFKLWRFGAYQEVHTLKIGPDCVPFVLHTNLLRDRCPAFFRKLLLCHQKSQDSAAGETTEDGESSDDASDVVHVRHIDVRMFRVFTAWLYTGRLVLPDHVPTPREHPRLVAVQAHKVIEAEGSWRDEDLVDVYLFASRHGLWTLANLSITTLWTQNGRYRRTTSLPAIQRAFEAGAFQWDDSLGSSGPNQEPWLARLQDYLLYEAARALDLIKACWLDLLLTAHLFPPPYNRAVHARYHEPSRAVECRASGQSRPFWEYEPCYFHYHSTKHDAKACVARSATARQQLDRTTPRQTALGPIHQVLHGTCTMLLGRGRVPFILHKELTCHYSSFLRSMFEDVWHGPPNDTVALVSEQPRDFALFAGWLYSQEITLPTIVEARMRRILKRAPSRTPGTFKPRPSEETVGRQGESSNGDSGIDVDSESSDSTKVGQSSDESDDEHPDLDELPARIEGGDKDHDGETNEARFLSRKHQQDLINLYAFAGRMKVPHLANAVMNKFIEQRENGHPYASSSPDNLRLAYKLCLPDSKLCSFFIQEAAFTYRGLPRDRSGYAQHLPPQFLHDLLEYQFTKGIFPKLREHVPSWRSNICEFHEHADDSEVQTCKRRFLDWQQALKAKGSEWEPVGAEFQSQNPLIGVLSPQQISSAGKGFAAVKGAPSKRSPSRPNTPSTGPLLGVPPLPPSDFTRLATLALPPRPQASSYTASTGSRSSTMTASPTSSCSSGASALEPRRAPPPPPAVYHWSSRDSHVSSSSDFEPMRSAPKPPAARLERISTSSEAESIACAARIAQQHEFEARKTEARHEMDRAFARKAGQEEPNIGASCDEDSDDTPPPTPLKDNIFFPMPITMPEFPSTSQEVRSQGSVQNPSKQSTRWPLAPIIVPEQCGEDAKVGTPFLGAKDPRRRKGIAMNLEKEAQQQVQGSAKAANFSRKNMAARMSRLRPFTHPKEAPQSAAAQALVEKETE